VTKYGHSFSEEGISDWLATRASCPLTQQALTLRDCVPNYALRAAATAWKLIAASNEARMFSRDTASTVGIRVRVFLPNDSRCSYSSRSPWHHVFGMNEITWTTIYSRTR